MMNAPDIQPGFFTLAKLAVYGSCSVRWLRARLVDVYNPLPHFRVGGKVLVKREEFDAWITTHRVARKPHDLQAVVEDVVGQVQARRRIA